MPKILHLVKKENNDNVTRNNLVCSLCGNVISFGNQNFYVTREKEFELWIEDSDIQSCLDSTKNNNSK